MESIGAIQELNRINVRTLAATVASRLLCIS